MRCMARNEQKDRVREDNRGNTSGDSTLDIVYRVISIRLDVQIV